MRNTFAEALYKAATTNPNVYIVVADISPAGSMAKFSEQYPERFINVGVAEQSMIGICAGLALKGCQPFAYTIATFTLYRPFEMVRDDVWAVQIVRDHPWVTLPACGSRPGGRIGAEREAVLLHAEADRAQPDAEMRQYVALRIDRELMDAE